MKHVVSLKKVIWLLAIYAALMIVLFTTNPFNASLLIVMVPFALLFVALLATFNTVIKYLPLTQRLSRRKRLFIAGGAAWLPVMLLILRSIDQLTARDGFIMAVFILALLVYISRTNFSRA